MKQRCFGDRPGNKGVRMDDKRWNGMAKGLVLGAAYCGAYLVLRYLSFDQWFLPAGLRAAALLLLPYRFWPYVFVGDTAALLTLRVPKAEQYSEMWAYLSPFLLIASISLAPRLIRNRLDTLETISRWLPVVGLSIALWSSICNNALNYSLGGPTALITPQGFVKYMIGDYLGILLITVPFLFFLRHKNSHESPKNLLRDALISIGVIAILFLTITLKKWIEPSLQQALLMLMMLPAIGLTLLHGWRGAAIGIVSANVAIAQTLTYTDIQGAHDQTVFFPQLALAIAASTLLLLGEKISDLFEHARQLGISEKQALELAQSSFLSNERNLREKVLYMAQMQVCMDDQRKHLVEMLKTHEQYSAAMLLNSKAVEHMQWFESQSAALYPLHIEERGLYAVIHPESFTDFWAGAAEVNYAQMRGQPRTLTVDLQLAAYRCICNGFALLSDCAPEAYRVKLRVWRRGSRRGISIKMTATPTQPPQISRASTVAEVDLGRRVKAYGGALRRRPVHGVHILLWEPADADPQLQDVPLPAR